MEQPSTAVSPPESENAAESSAADSPAAADSQVDGEKGVDDGAAGLAEERAAVPEEALITFTRPPAPAPPVRIPPADPVLERLASYAGFSREREVALRVFPQDAVVKQLVDGRLRNLDPIRREKDVVWFRVAAGALLIDAPGYRSRILPLPPDTAEAEAKLDFESSILQPLAEAPTEYQPKSVRYDPSGRFLFTTHLGDRTALSQYASEPLRWIRDLDVPEEYQGDSGFVETLILPNRGELWLSQMNRDVVHVFDLSSGTHEATIPLSGRWPKVLLASADGRRVYVSCWLSESVSEIDAAGRREIRRFDVSGQPRGMALSADGTDLLVAIFSSSAVDRIDLETGRREASHDVAPGRAYAMRHIVADRVRGEYYVTAMGVRRVYRLSEDGRWLGSWTVGEKPNTCALSPDGRRLFVSCRGPNNPDTGYLTRGYEYGKIYVIDLVEGEVEGWIWGRDQPTGLDVSPDGSRLAFTDFLSHRLEVYRIVP